MCFLLGAIKHLGGLFRKHKILISRALADSKERITPLPWVSIAIQKLQPLPAVVVCSFHQILTSPLSYLNDRWSSKTNAEITNYERNCFILSKYLRSSVRWSQGDRCFSSVIAEISAAIQQLPFGRNRANSKRFCNAHPKAYHMMC